MIPEFFGQLVGLMIGALIASPIVIWSAKRFSRYYVDPPVAVRGGVIYTYLMIMFVVWPAINLMDVVDLSKFQIVQAALIGGTVGLLFGLFLMLLDHIGFLARLPFIGRSLNAYFLALAKANLGRVQKNVRRYEEIDAMFATTAKA